MIIIEGPDNSGKTTLAQEICESMDSLYIKTYQTKWTHQELRAFQEDLLDMDYRRSDDRQWVFDRYPVVSHYIYSRVIRNDHSYGWDDLRELLLPWKDAGVEYIYCRPDLSIIEDYGDRPQMAGVKENTRELVDLYDIMFEAIREMGITTIHHDWSK